MGLNRKLGLMCQPYEFKWIENLGFQMIRSIKYTVGGKIIQEFTGQYLYNMIQRDFSKAKKDLLDEMTGNIPEMNDPANYSNNNGNYPSVIQTSNNNEPSIRGRKLYIPLNIWSTLSSKMAFPLVALNKNQLRIEIVCRPIRELFVIRDMNYYMTRMWDVSSGLIIPDPFNPTGNLTNVDIPKPRPIYDISYELPPYISTMNYVDPKYQLYLFLTQTATDVYSSITNSGIKFLPHAQRNWYADPHLISTYAFLGNEEIQRFRSGPQSYLIKEVHESILEIRAHTQEKVRFETQGLVASWMWFFQRQDAHARNEWSNYTNWDYNNILPYSCKSIFEISSNPITPYYVTPCALCDFPYIPKNVCWDTHAGSSTNVTCYIQATNYAEFVADVLEGYGTPPIPIANIETNCINAIPNCTPWGYSEAFAIIGGQPANVCYDMIHKKPSEIALRLEPGQEITFDNGCPPQCSLPSYLIPPYAPYSLSNDMYVLNPYVTGPYHAQNNKYIMQTWALFCDGKLRENTQYGDVLNLTEKYVRTTGNGQSGLYCYNFSLNTDPFLNQPTGAMNLTNFKFIEFECSIFRPFTDISTSQHNICNFNPSKGDNILLGQNVKNNTIYKYDYNLHIMEERYNLLTVDNDKVYLMFFRT